MQDATSPRLESALIIPVPEADSLIDQWRRRYDPAALLGIPAHITLIYPFLPPERLDQAALGGTRALVARHPAFRFRLTRIGDFPTAIYLEPEPAAPFIRLIEALSARFPDAPPYGGEFNTIVPHVTIAQVTDPSALSRLREELVRDVSARLPIDAQAREVRLVEGPRDALWRLRDSFSLGRARRGMTAGPPRVS